MKILTASEWRKSEDLRIWLQKDVLNTPNGKILIEVLLGHVSSIPDMTGGQIIEPTHAYFHGWARGKRDMLETLLSLTEPSRTVIDTPADYGGEPKDPLAK